MDDDTQDVQQQSRSERGVPARIVRNCPWCGEHVGSFWGRRDDEGGHWCESCQAFFHVKER